jgi:hypothetical protein
MTLKTILWGAGIFWAVYLYVSAQEIHHPKGILINTPPLQYATNASPFQSKGYTITPVQSYELEARVLSKKIITLVEKPIYHPWIWPWVGGKCRMKSMSKPYR